MNDELLKSWIAEEERPFSGWDFSSIRGKILHQPLSWDYIAEAKKLLSTATSVLDMGTGGGEILASLAPLPAHTVAVEAWDTNVVVAKERLAPLGVQVLYAANHQPMPLPSSTFDLVLNRHSWFDMKDVARVLRPGGIFLTQQVDGRNLDDLAEFFGRRNPWLDRTPEKVREEIVQAGLRIHEEQSWFGKMTVTSVAALVYFLHAIPWTVKDFSVSKDLPALEKIQQAIDNHTPPSFNEGRYFFLAEKPRA